MMLKEVAVVWKFQDGIDSTVAEKIRTFIGNRQVLEHDTCEELELCSSRYTVLIYAGQPVEVVVKRSNLSTVQALGSLFD